MPKVLITGASGLLGRALMIEFKKKCWDVCGLAYSRARDGLIKVDLNNVAEVKKIVHNFEPDVIVHSAAERSPDKVEKDYEATKRLNVICSKTLAEIAREMEIVFIYISTDYVFDGFSPPYSENDKPNPLNQYGISKLEGENSVLDTNPESIILRIPVLYGDEEFVGESAISCLIQNFQKQVPVKVSNFEVRYPSHVDDIAVICCNLSEKRLKDSNIKSIFHWCGAEPLTKYEMAKIMSEVFNVSSSHLLADNNPSAGTPRPKNTQLSCEKLKALSIGQHTLFHDGIKRSFNKFFI